MPIDTGAVPEAAIAAVEQAMKARLAGSAFTTSNLRQVTSGALHRSFPHRVAYLSLDQVRRGHDLQDATRPGGWRFLIHEGDKAIAAVRVVEDGAAAYRLGEFSEGAFVTGTEQVVRFAERELEAVRNGHFEPVLLMAPEIFVIALWLRNLEGGNDHILTIPTAAAAAAGDKALAVRTGDAFLAEVRSLAESMSQSQRSL
jgi:hypothetical protein